MELEAYALNKHQAHDDSMGLDSLQERGRSRRGRTASRRASTSSISSDSQRSVSRSRSSSRRSSRRLKTNAGAADNDDAPQLKSLMKSMPDDYEEGSDELGHSNIPCLPPPPSSRASPRLHNGKSMEKEQKQQQQRDSNSGNRATAKPLKSSDDQRRRERKPRPSRRGSTGLSSSNHSAASASARSTRSKRTEDLQDEGNISGSDFSGGSFQNSTRSRRTTGALDMKEPDVDAGEERAKSTRAKKTTAEEGKDEDEMARSDHSAGSIVTPRSPRKRRHRVPGKNAPEPVAKIEQLRSKANALQMSSSGPVASPKRTARTIGSSSLSRGPPSPRTQKNLTRSPRTQQAVTRSPRSSRSPGLGKRSPSSPALMKDMNRAEQTREGGNNNKNNNSRDFERSLNMMVKKPSITQLNLEEQSPRSLTDLEASSLVDNASKGSKGSKIFGSDSETENDGSRPVLQFDPTQIDNVFSARQKGSTQLEIGSKAVGTVSSFVDPVGEAKLCQEPKTSQPIFDLLGSDHDKKEAVRNREVDNNDQSEEQNGEISTDSESEPVDHPEDENENSNEFNTTRRTRRGDSTLAQKQGEEDYASMLNADKPFKEPRSGFFDMEESGNNAITQEQQQSRRHRKVDEGQDGAGNTDEKTRKMRSRPSRTRPSSDRKDPATSDEVQTRDAKLLDHHRRRERGEGKSRSSERRGHGQHQGRGHSGKDSRSRMPRTNTNTMNELATTDDQPLAAPNPTSSSSRRQQLLSDFLVNNKEDANEDDPAQQQQPSTGGPPDRRQGLVKSISRYFSRSKRLDKAGGDDESIAGATLGERASALFNRKSKGKGKGHQLLGDDSSSHHSDGLLLP